MKNIQDVQGKGSLGQIDLVLIYIVVFLSKLSRYVMKRWVSIFALPMIFLLVGCSDEDSGVLPPSEASGRQQQISWPSLANSPWPMNHGDPQSTGRSRVAGPSMGQLEWEIDLPTTSAASIAVTEDSMLVTGARFAAVDLNGSIEWVSSVPPPPANDLVTTPIVTRDGTVIAASSDGWVYGVDGGGALKWQLQLGEPIVHQGSNLGLDGTFYCVSRWKRLFAVSSGGQLRWSLYDSHFSGATHCVLTFSPDGRTLYVPGEGVTVNGVDVESQAIGWRFGTSRRLEVAPMVDSYGNIYVLGVDSIVAPEPSLISLSPDGTVRWIFAHGNRFDQIYAGDLTIDMNGNIYFILDTLYSVDWNGNLRWKRDLTLAGSRPAGDVPLVCDDAGRVYATVLDIGPDRYTTIAFGSDGSVLWSMISSNGYWIDSSPAVPWSGTLVMAGLKNTKLYKLK